MNQPDPLSDLLQRWQPQPSDAPDFARGVRQRLASAAMAAPVTPLARVLAWPASLPLAAGLAILLGMGSALGLHHAQAEDILADAYARSIDPVQLSAQSAHADHGHAPAP